MPRCLMAKKWKAYPWPDREDDFDNLDEHHRRDGEEEEEGRCLQGAEDEEQQHQHQQQQQQHQQEEDHHNHHHHHQHHNHQKRLATSRSEPEDEEIDVVGDADGRTPPQTCWGPHSPTAGATAPSPPPLNASGALYYHGYTPETWIGHEEPPKYATLRSAAELAIDPSNARSISPSPSPPRDHHHHHHQNHHHHHHQQQQQQVDHASSTSFQSSNASVQNLPPRKSLAMCFTSTGIALSLPPKKKDIYRPYSLQPQEIRTPAEEDLSAAQAILDLSASPAAPNHSVFIHTLGSPAPPPPAPPTTSSSGEIIAAAQSSAATSVIQATIPPSAPVSVLVPVISQNPAHQQDEQSLIQDDCTGQQLDPQSPATAENGNKTVAYTYEAFFVSDGRSKKRAVNAAAAAAVPEKEATQPDRPKYTCTECGKQYATSSNLSRHKQTHRSLDSQSAKKCIHCGKAYVSMPALAMHVLTHKLAHSCGVCGKMFSRPWLLQGHLRSHTGEKPYGCAHCGKAFADRSNLRAHMQTHSSDKNYECSRCHKTFALKSYLNKHLESACLRDEDAPPSSGNRL